MNPNDAWQRFTATGKISDYLMFKNIQKNKDKKDADNDRSIGSKGDRYR